MQGFSFDTFQVSEGNRAAFEWCQSLAAAPNKVNGTVVLLGPEGAGKSHLLWAMVKAIRSSEFPTGLALVVPNDFPDKVRQLIHNPAPIQNGRNAILLVDGLESYREELPDLEGVVDAFLSNRQAVILSSNVHPQRLNRISSRLRAILSAGRIVELQRDHQAGDGEEDQFLGRIDRLEEERAQLKAELGRRKNAESELARLRASVEALRSENDKLRTAEGPRHSEELNRLRARIADLETAPPRGAAPGDDRSDDELQGRLAEAEREADAALAKQALLQGQLAGAKHTAEQLQAVTAERDLLASELNQLRRHAEAAVAIIEAKTAERAHVERKILKSLESFTVRLFAHEHPKLNEEEWQRMEAELGDARSLGEAFRKQLAAERAHYQVQVASTEEELEHAQALIDEARAEQGRLLVTVDSLRGRLQATEFELEKARKQLALQNAEMDALRHEAASQVASANIQAGAMEHRLTGLEETFMAIREAGKNTGSDVRQYSGELANMASMLDSLATRLARLQELTVDPPAVNQADDFQGVLFDPDTLRVRAALPAADGQQDGVTVPQRESLLRDVAQQALALDDRNNQESA